MKAFMFLAAAGAATALASALPARGPAGEEELIWYHQPSYNRHQCFRGNHGHDSYGMERVCGTYEYCRAHDDPDRVGRYLAGAAEYSTAAECFAAHRPGAPRPDPPGADWRGWHYEAPEGYAGACVDAPREAPSRALDELACGTAAFCAAFDDQPRLRAAGIAEPEYASRAACLANRLSAQETAERHAAWDHQA